MSLGDRIFDSINVVLLGLLALIIIYPLVYVLSASFSDPVSVASGDMILWPVNLTLENYEEVFKNQSIITGYRNSLIILVSGTALNLVMTVLAAFPMSRRDLWGRNVMMKLMTFTMFFSGGLIPTYLLITRTLGLMNSWLALILPGAISVYNMIIMRTYFQTSIPYELQEAADIDGCSPFGVLIRIILPLSGPILAVIGLYYGVGHWNSYFSALLYINREELQPLQLYLRRVLTLNSNQSLLSTGSDEAARQAMRAETIKYAVIVVSSVPMLVIYPFVQKFFVKGVMIGAIKG
ncbi:MAG TPA: carbohydrate ABC transporter permease [Candidatus Faecivicinus avistercoris]|nr:carbohydrate ABC transporter permease [Candidatus Faecivicinus avistercoris]